MVYILNDAIIKNLTCSVCQKYLSVLPVKVYPNRKIKCGRCCEKDDDGIESTYCNVIKNCLFKCINRYEGCNKLLAFDEVVQHESKCASGHYNCPKCDYKFSGSAYHLVLHYTKQHPRSILKNDNFVLRIRKDFRERYLYLVMDRIFFVLVEYLSTDKVLYLSAVSLKPRKNITQWFTVKQFQKQHSITTTEKKLCHSLEDFQCDYFTVKVTTATEVNCKLHLDLSQDIRNIDQISSVNKAPEKTATVSIYTQTDSWRHSYRPILRKPNVDIRNIDQISVHKEPKKITFVSTYTQTDPGQQFSRRRPVLKTANVEDIGDNELDRQMQGLELISANIRELAGPVRQPLDHNIRSQQASESAVPQNLSNPLNPQPTSSRSDMNRTEVEDQKPKDNASISTNSQSGPDTLKPRPEVTKESEEQEHSVSLSAYVKSFMRPLRRSLPKPRSNVNVNQINQEQRHNASVTASVQTLSNIIGVKLSDDFKTKYPGYGLTACGTAVYKDDDRVELVCSNCRQFTGCNVFSCQLNKHIVCWDCKAWCGICDTPTNGWNVKVTDMNELLLLPCKWQCGELFQGNLLTQHELNCKEPIFHCPSCSLMLKNFDAMRNHLTVYHKNYPNISLFNLTGYLKDPVIKKQTVGDICFFQNGLFFKMSWRYSSGLYKVEIKSFGDTNLYELAIICDKGKAYNKIANGKVEFDVNNNPKFYLKRIRNL